MFAGNVYCIRLWLDNQGSTGRYSRLTPVSNERTKVHVAVDGDTRVCKLRAGVTSSLQNKERRAYTIGIKIWRICNRISEQRMFCCCPNNGALAGNHHQPLARSVLVQLPIPFFLTNLFSFNAKRKNSFGDGSIRVFV